MAMLAWLRLNPLRGMAIGQLLVILALTGLCAWQRHEIGSLHDWRDSVTGALTHAVDQRDKAGRLLPVKAEDASRHILALGKFKTDVLLAQAQAAVDDASHSLTVERQDAAINRKGSHDFDSRLERARLDAAAARASLQPAHHRPDLAPDSMWRPGNGTAGNGDGGEQSTPVRALSDAGSETDAPTAPDGLPASSEAASCSPLNIDERLLATEQAIQLDELIATIENFAKVER